MHAKLEHLLSKSLTTWEVMTYYLVVHTGPGPGRGVKGWGVSGKRGVGVRTGLEGLLVGCLTSQHQASVSQGRICSDNFTCCHTEIEVADPTFYLTQSQYTDTGPTSPSAEPITPGAWQGSHWSANFEVTGMTRPRKKSRRKLDSNPGPSALEVDALTTRPTRRWDWRGVGVWDRDWNRVGFDDGGKGGGGKSAGGAIVWKMGSLGD